MADDTSLPRRLGTTDAVVIGLGSMIGAGVFAAFIPAAAVAGSGLLIGLAIAAVVAFCNALASAQLATVYPTSGGTYVYGRERLGHWSGFVAGWSFVVGKTASCAAMAMTFAAYALPSGWQKPAAIAAVLILATVNYFGVTKTARLARVLVAIVILVLIVVVVAAFAGGQAQPVAVTEELFSGGWYGILQSAGLLFFAFAGYARIATMGEEVRDPARAIPRAIIIALSVTLAIYALIAVALLSVLGSDAVAQSTAPLVDVVTVSDWDWASPLVRIAASAAALGALLALIAGVSRTGLAMARNRDLPVWLASVHPVHQVPHHAELAVAVVVSALVLVVDLRGAIGFSSFGVLLYYFIANVAAFTQPREQRRYPKTLQVLGAGLCLVLVVTLPLGSTAIGLGVLAIGIIYRILRMRWSARSGRD